MWPQAIANKVFSNYGNYLAILFGCLLPFSYAPANVWILAFVSLTGITLVWLQSKSALQAYIQGILFSAAYYFIGLFGLFSTMKAYFKISAVASLLFLFAIVIFSFFFFSAIGFILRKFCFRFSKTISLLLVFPSFVLMTEWARSYIISFPWILLGYSQVGSPLQYYATVVSVYGVTFLVVAIAGLISLALVAKSYKSKIAYLSTIVIIFLGGLMLQTGNWTTTELPVKKVTLIASKFPRQFSEVDIERFIHKVVNNNKDSSIFVWPENSYQRPALYSMPLLDSIDNFAKKKNVTIILGMPIIAAAVDEADDLLYNSLIAVGAGSGIYHKEKLMYIAEYIPIVSLFVKKPRIAGQLLSAPGVNPQGRNQDLVVLPGSKLLPAICSDIFFPKVIQRRLKLNDQAKAIVLISNEAWIDSYLGKAQYLDIVKMRAVETGKDIIRSSVNSLFSGVISSHDNKFEKRGVDFIINTEFFNRAGNTFWVEHGDYIVYLSLLAVALSLLFVGINVGRMYYSNNFSGVLSINSGCSSVRSACSIL